MVNVCLIFFMLGFLTHFALVNPRMILNGVIWYVTNLIQCAVVVLNLYAIRRALVAMHELSGHVVHGLDELAPYVVHGLDELAASYLDLLLRFVSLLLSLFE